MAEEDVLLRIRLAEGLALSSIPADANVDSLVADGLLLIRNDRAVLTPRGRLLADAVVRQLLL
jgi:oxygen-independent coproporphyrinogen-3 oxidase